MKRSLKFFNFAAVALALGFMASCSQENTPLDPPTPDQPEAPELTLGNSTASYSVKSSDQSRVNNFNFPKSRSAVDFEMPKCPSLPDNFQTNSNYGTFTTGNYVLSDYNDGIKINGSPVIYITGNVNFTYWNTESGNVTFYIMPGGTFTFNSTLTPGTTIYNYGEIKGNMTLANDVTIYSEGDMVFGQLGMNSPEGGNACAKIFSKGTVIADDIRLNGEIYACAIIAKNKVQLNDNGEFHLGYIKAKNLEFNAAKIILDNYGLIDVEETIFFSNADTRIEVDGNKAVMAAKYFCTNDKNWVKNQISPEVYCWVEEAYVGSEYYRGETIDLYALGLQNSDINSDVNGWVPEDGCHPSFGNVPEEPSYVPTWKIIKTGEIEDTPDHDHNIDKESLRKLSATCIIGDGTNFYASYHMRGLNYAGQDWADSKDEIEGCIEYFTVNGEGDIALQSFMWTQEFDFNHILLDNDKIVTVGHGEKKGAVLSYLPLSFTNKIGATADDLSYVLLTTDEAVYIDGKLGQIVGGYQSAGDGNCLIKVGDEYFVTTSQGYLKVAYDSESQAWKQVRDYGSREHGIPMFGRHNGGSVKHIINNNGNIVMLALDNPTPEKYDFLTSSPASLISYSSSSLSSFPLGNPVTTTISTPVISPIDGKNVIAVDPANTNRLYICMGKGGLAVVDNGSVTKIWKHVYSKSEDAKQEGQESELPVNGVAVDNNHIYVANGNLVSVLDKSSMEEIATYHADSKISANYIFLSNGYVYVAYGQDGILQLQLQYN